VGGGPFLCLSYRRHCSIVDLSRPTRELDEPKPEGPCTWKQALAWHNLSEKDIERWSSLLLPSCELCPPLRDTLSLTAPSYPNHQTLEGLIDAIVGS